MKYILLLFLLVLRTPGFAQATAAADSAFAGMTIQLDFTSEDENKLLREDDSVKYYEATGDAANTVCINEELSTYKLLNKEHKTIAEGQFVTEGEKLLQEGRWTERFDNGKIKITGAYRRGKQMGTWREYHTNGKLKVVCNYAIISENGEFFSCPSGSYEAFYQNGKTKVSGFYSAAGTKVKDTMRVDDPVTGATVNRVAVHYEFYPEKTGRWEYFTEAGEPEKNDDF